MFNLPTVEATLLQQHVATNAHISKLQVQLHGKNGKGWFLQTLQLSEHKLTKAVRGELNDDPKEIILKIGTVHKELSDRWNAVGLR